MTRHDHTEPDAAEIVLSEERAVPGTTTHESGRVRVVTHVDTETVGRRVPRAVEHAELDRVDALEGDSGQVETLPDGSLSIPVFEEVLVVEKRRVVRERVVVRKHTVHEEQEVSAELRRERLEVLSEGDARVVEDGPAASAT